MIGKQIQSFLGIILLLSNCQPKQNETKKVEISTQTTIIDSSEAVNSPDRSGASTEEKNKSITPAQLIVPGKSIGQTALQMKAEEVNQILGKSDRSDAAMGKAWAIWYSRPTASDTIRKETTIYFATNMGGSDEASRVKQIRVTSPFFQTAGHVGVGTALKAIQQAFPNLQKAKTYTSAKTKQSITILDDAATGIAFEFNANETCVAVVVHEPQQPVNTIYINLFP
ncbi:MAG: hypothetical protein COW65_01355 [Cytophagales bacterium CG18_big_fil_WC_8_21_14_2_50_42_9]|nr:MAG: hypothetical protein COW65_01355 [Cytophagales bacterium CG18_big_fil_WC_8_21_14_2_50_42_9]